MKVGWGRGLFLDHWHLAEMIEKAFRRARWRRTWRRAGVGAKTKRLGDLVDFPQASRLRSLVLHVLVLLIQIIDEALAFLLHVRRAGTFVEQRRLRRDLWNLRQHRRKREAIRWKVQRLCQQVVRIKIELWRVRAGEKGVERRRWR